MQSYDLLDDCNTHTYTHTHTHREKDRERERESPAERLTGRLHSPHIDKSPEVPAEDNLNPAHECMDISQALQPNVSCIMINGTCSVRAQHSQRNRATLPILRRYVLMHTQSRTDYNCYFCLVITSSTDCFLYKCQREVSSCTGNPGAI